MKFFENIYAVTYMSRWADTMSNTTFVEWKVSLKSSLISLPTSVIKVIGNIPDQRHHR